MEHISKLVEESLMKAESLVDGIADDAMRVAAFGAILSYFLSAGELHETKGTPGRKLRVARKSSGPTAWLEELINDGFFVQPKSGADILEELAAGSHHLKSTDLTRPLEALCHDKKLRRSKRPVEGSSRQVYHWSNWG